MVGAARNAGEGGHPSTLGPPSPGGAKAASDALREADELARVGSRLRELGEEARSRQFYFERTRRRVLPDGRQGGFLSPLDESLRGPPQGYNQMDRRDPPLPASGPIAAM